LAGKEIALVGLLLKTDATVAGKICDRTNERVAKAVVVVVDDVV